MDHAVVEQLRELNRAFYAFHAASFAATRHTPWPTWFEFPRRAADIPAIDSVLDLGCGNGRYLRFLQAHGFRGDYTGIDGSKMLLRFAREAFGTARYKWLEADVLDGAFESSASLVAAWGVLHHIPGFDNRLAFLRRMSAAVAPGGALAVSLWQFRNHPRFASRECDPASFGIDAAGLETGDALLGWQNDREQPRYCHHFGDDEIERVCARMTAGRATWRRASDVADRYNAYLIWTPA